MEDVQSEPVNAALQTALPEHFALAANSQLAGNSRLGIAPVASTSRWGFSFSISSNTLGLSESLYDDDAGSRSTGKERDAESGNDYFGARYYSSAMGRFMSPDWSAKAEPVPYAKLDNPQSLNLYAYVGNSPLVRVDPDGHGCHTVFGMTVCFGDPPPLPAPPPTPAPPSAPPIAALHTDMKGGTTTLTVSTHEKTTDLTIQTQNKVDSRSKPGANNPYSTDNVVGVKTDAAHADRPEYGPKGAFIDTGDSRGRAIHGGGSGLTDGTALGDRQSKLMPTYGCTRGFNDDVIKLGNAITSFQQSNPGTPIPYDRQ